MKLPRFQKRSYSMLAAFLIPFLGMLGVMICSGYTPFGQYSMLYSDMYHQYYPFFVAFRRALRSGEPLLYTWSAGLGMDYLGLISYYLASPLNLISVFMPEKWLLGYFSLLVPIKLGMASLFFAIFLRGTFERNDSSVALFGGFYGLCAWALGYQWNVMWLDTFALLPLVAMGTVRLLRDRKFVLYTITLFFSVCTNYYIGLFTCFFVFLLFFCYEICRWISWRRFAADLLRIAFFSALALGMTAFLEIPAFAALQTTQSSVNNFPHGFKLNIATENTWRGLLDAMRQVAGNLGGGTEPTFKEGLPNVYCGVGVLMLSWCYFLHGDIKLKDKLCCGFLLVFFILSFILRQLDYIWHGFHFTNMIPYRFSFLLSFVLLYMAYKAWILRRKLHTWQIGTAAALTLLCFACSDLRLQWAYLTYNLCCFTVFLGILIADCIRPKIPEDPKNYPQFRSAQLRRMQYARSAMLIAMVLELVANIVCFGLYFPGTWIANYPRGTEQAASMIRYMQEREQRNPFFRAETTHSQTLNDGALNGYNGISAFTSSANVKTTEFMQALGYGAKNTYNRYCYEESSPVADLFLGIKYRIERDGTDRACSYFAELYRYGAVSLLENQYYLPLGFLTESTLARLDFTSGSGFRFQNALLTAASGCSEEAWQILTGDCLEIEGQDVTVSEQKSSGYCAYSDGLNGSQVIYTYTADRAGFFCVDLNLPKRNTIAVWKNDTELYTESLSLPQMLAVADVQPGDRVQIRVQCSGGESGTINITAAILNTKCFEKHYGILAGSQLKLTAFQTTRLEGFIECDREGLLYTSIPQDGNWHVSVDGREEEITLIGGVMCGVELTQGSHDIVFYYHNSAFSLGWRLSLACAICFAAMWYINRTPRKKGKYER